MVSIELSEGAGRVWAAARPPVRLVWRARPIPCRLVARWPSHNHGEQSRRPATYRSARRLRLRAHWRLTPGSAATRRQLGASARGPSGLDGAVLPWSPPGRTDSRREMNQESHRPVELAHPRCWRCFHDLRVPASPTRTVEHARGYRRRSTTATANAIIYTNAAETLDDVDPNIACERSRRRPSLAQRYRKRIQRYLKRIRYRTRARKARQRRQPLAVLDYRDHLSAARPTPDGTSRTRPDPRSNYRAGFEVRTSAVPPLR